MEPILFKLILSLSLLLFFIPKKLKYYFIILLQVSLIILTSFWAFSTFREIEIIKIPFMQLLDKNIFIKIDKLSAFFIFIINFTSFTGLLYAKGYLKPYFNKKTSIDFSLHYFNFLWLHISMLLVVMLRDALAFLIIWEIMSLSSFFLVIFESEKKETIKIGISYLIQMHIGVLFLLSAFLYVYVKTKTEFSFDGLELYFNNNSPFWVFLLFFIGFGIKAGFIPFHSWLPNAHPAAPSHVSGVMSGVMIKMGIYGILRVLIYIHHDLFNIGLLILVISIISGLLGVSFAIVQHDVKKLLAYHSIENIGIIGIGIGIGVIGIAVKQPILSVLGFSGGLLHILNHSLFKSLLFYTSGSVYKQTHTRNIEELGGLMKTMPKTALFFLLGAIAISGLPPFNGFISEFLIYSGMFKSLYEGSLTTNIIILFAFSALVIIGGLAVFCFTKVFSIIFLGTPRTDKAKNVIEVENSMLLSNLLIAIMIILIGIIPTVFMGPLSEIVNIFVKDSLIINQVIPTLNNITITTIVFIVLIIFIYFLRNLQQKKQVVKNGELWGCAYSGANPSLHQYTATSYANNYIELSNKIVNVNNNFKEFDESEIFPKEHSFKTSSFDFFEKKIIIKPTKKLLLFFEKIAIFQTGRIQDYLLYSLAFILIIFTLTFLDWI